MALDLQPIQQAQPKLDLQQFPSQPTSAPAVDNNQVMPEEPLVNRIANSAPVEAVNALGGGIQQGLAKAAGTALGSPKVTNALSPPSFVQDAMNNNPTTAMIGQGTGIVGAGAAAIGAAGAATGAALGAGIVSDVAANTIAGSLLAGPGNRVEGGIAGSIGGAVGAGLAKVGDFIANASTLGTQIKNAVGEISQNIKGSPAQVAVQSQANMWNTAKATEDQLFNAFRTTPGKVDAAPVAYKAAQFLNKNADELTPQQQKVITNLITNASNAKTIADLHDARKIFAYDFGKFTEGKPLTATAATEFRGVNDTVSDVMKSSADNLGVGDKFKQANDFYKGTILPLMNSGAKDTADALENISKDPMGAAKVTDSLLQKYVNPSKPDVAKAFLNTLDPTGRQAIETHLVTNALNKATAQNGTIDPVAFKSIIEDHQKAYGQVFSDGTNKMLTGVNRAIEHGTKLFGVDTTGIPKTSLGLSALGATAYAAGPHAAIGLGAMGASLYSLMKSQMGQNLLIKAGSAGGQAVGRDIANGVAIQGILNASQINSQ